MKLKTLDTAEFRIKRKYESSNGSVSWFYTFENDGLGSFELWSKENLSLEKGKTYFLVFSMSFYQGSQRINLIEVVPSGK